MRCSNAGVHLFWFIFPVTSPRERQRTGAELISRLSQVKRIRTKRSARLSPKSERYKTVYINAAPCGSHPTFIGSVPEKCSRISPDLHCIIGRCPMRFSSYVYRQRSREMLSHFSRPSLYHRRCPMRFSSYVYRQCSREMLPYFSRSLLYHKRGRRIGGAAKREEVDPTDSQFLQAQGHVTSFVLKHKAPERSIP